MRAVRADLPRLRTLRPRPPPVFISDRTRVRFAPVHKLRLSYPWPSSQGKYSSSGPIERRHAAAEDVVRVSNSCPIFGGGREANAKAETDWRKVLEASPDTVGAAGLALRYANVVVAAERLLRAEAAGLEEDAAAEREEIYEMLPAAMRSTVRAKLRDWWKDRARWTGGWRRGGRRR
uniref:DUF668 domain-containing protein n=1 Tax=Ananas comosus var. bracteatus TaxID=296719 RepID=A0A6V7QTA4_ANACO